MQIRYVTVDGVGETRNEDVDEGTTVREFFLAMNPGKEEEKYIIRLNRVKQELDTVLQEGDRVSVAPSTIKGA